MTDSRLGVISTSKGLGEPSVETGFMKSARSRRIPSAGVIELHVFCVPAELWSSKLNTVSNHAINKFISVGFIRVLPDLNLKALRQQVGELLGARTVDDKFAFLKCVGRIRNSWKKKYFESKKLTAPLEETSCRLRKELEQHYLKLLQHLEARDSRKRPRKSTSTSDPKNELIIQITTLKHEIDQLYRSVENAKMKLITEIKLRKQTSTDLRALRAELAQKKTQSSLNRLHGGSVTHSLNVLVT
ncbi:spermatogenesis-associated protein 1 [Rhincodon typus]|uniref:spermatogenesis-associated protein 1 n=1 Tax=Rhincodon typus TaxID=259920 RepID=UPI00202E5C87|nr:spermatogenesis-associated protein 1 [Rhincodon typus]